MWAASAKHEYRNYCAHCWHVYFLGKKCRKDKGPNEGPPRLTLGLLLRAAGVVVEAGDGDGKNSEAEDAAAVTPMPSNGDFVQ